MKSDKAARDAPEVQAHVLGCITMTSKRDTFDVRSFGGIYVADRLIRTSVVRALEAEALSEGAGVASLTADRAAVDGGWSEFAVAAFIALTAGVAGATQ